MAGKLRKWVTLGFCTSVAGLLSMPFAMSLGAEAPQTLLTIGAVHELAREQAAKAYPVRATAVVAYAGLSAGSADHPAVFVVDGQQAIYVLLDDKNPTDTIRAGERVEITGVTAPGDFAPMIAEAHVRRLGNGPLPPEGSKVSVARLRTGDEDARWVAVEGTVEAVRSEGSDVILRVGARDGDIAAVAVQDAGVDYRRLEGAQVRLNGVAASLFNERSQIVGAEIFFPGLQTVTVEKAAPEDPFAAPVEAIGHLLTYSPGRDLVERSHVRGAVTLFWPGRLVCIEDRSAPLCAQTGQKTDLQTGDVVDLLGFPEIGEVTPSLHEGRFRKSGASQHVGAIEVDADRARSGAYDSRLVEIEGEIVGQQKAGKDPTIVVSSSGENYLVSLPDSPDASKLRQIATGSKVRLTGVCVNDVDGEATVRHMGSPVIRGFHLLLRSVGDVTVLQNPPWWTPQHALNVLGLVLAATLCALAWVIYLRHRIKLQAAQLRYNATHDGLTGLWNRKAVLDLLRQEMEFAREEAFCIGIIMLDADHFKRVNDTHGHLAGDAVLREIAERLRRAVRRTDHVGRYGGEEFLVVLPGCSLPEAARWGEKLRATIAARPVEAESAFLEVTVSVGTAILEPGRNTQWDALAAADCALYKAKHGGRNRVVSGGLWPPGRSAEKEGELFGASPALSLA